MTSSAALKLEPNEWTEYFRSIAVDSDGVLATVGLLAAEPTSSGDLPQRRLRAIGYDASEDVLEVAVGGAVAHRAALRYFVSAPRTITVAESDHTRVILIDDASGAQTLICVFDPRSWHPPAQPSGVPSRGRGRHARVATRTFMCC